MRFDCNIYFLFEKQAFNGLEEVIGIQNILNTINFQNIETIEHTQLVFNIKFLFIGLDYNNQIYLDFAIFQERSIQK